MKCKTMVAVLVGLICASALAQEGLGLGVILGEPTGLSVKYWLDNEQAIDGAAAWSFWDGDGFQIHADYLWHDFELLGVGGEDADKLPLYYGVGARLKFRDDEGRHHDDDTFFGIRIPVGVSYLFKDHPFDLFAEIVPIVDLAPDVDLRLDLAVGLRFYVQ
jgi:hypothetical protein